MNAFCLPEIENSGQSRRTLPSKSRYIRRSTVNITLGVILPLSMLTAGMQAAAADRSVDDLPSAVAGANDVPSVPDASSDKLHFQLGGGAVNGPRYPGSRFDFTRPVLFPSLSYGRYFLGGVPGGEAAAGLGAYLVHSEQWAVGVGVGGDSRKPRRASDDPVLRGWGDIPGTGIAGMFANYNMDWLSVRGSVALHGHHEGLLASLGVEAKYHATPRLTLSIGPQVTWINNQYATTFFGVDAAQGQIAGIAPHQARNGINSVGGAAGARFLLTDRWSLAANVKYGRLQGDAANSPVTTDKTQRLYGAFVMYRFR